jgi:L-ribulose-5-phosphate 3-epimerase
LQFLTANLAKRSVGDAPVAARENVLLADGGDTVTPREVFMKHDPSRRGFLKATVGSACTAPLTGLATALPVTAIRLAPPAPPRSSIKKAVLISMFPEKMSYTDRFKLARETGFEAVEAQTVKDQQQAEAIKKAADEAKIRIHSVMNMDHWKFPLSSSDPAAVEMSIEGMKTSLHNAKLWGADAVLLVPAVVTPQVTYKQAWERSQKQIRRLIPLAEELKVIIAVEEVWNKFLLSPLEFAAYVDEFKSPWVKTYFDVGNVVLFGYPQDWIHTQAKRIVKVHLKDFKRRENGYSWVGLGEGDIDWPAVRNAFTEVGYTGYVTTELEGGDESYLREVSKRVDRLVLGV